VLLVIIAVGLLGLGEQGAGWLSAAWAVGGIEGGFGATLLTRHHLARGLPWGMLLAGAPLVVIGVWAYPPVALPVLVVLGVGYSLIEVGILTYTPRLVAADVMARVFGAQQTLSAVAMALGAGAASVLVNWLDADGALIVAGVLLPIVGQLMRSRVHRLDAGATPDARTLNSSEVCRRSLPCRSRPWKPWPCGRAAQLSRTARTSSGRARSGMRSS